MAHVVLLVPALLFVGRAPETVAARPRPVRRPPRLSFPRTPVFAGAALAGFAANAQLGLYAALAPTFLSDVLDLDSLVMAGCTGALLFAMAGLTQLAVGGIDARAQLVAAAVLLAVGTVVLVLALDKASLPVFLVATAIGGVGGGLGFSGGLATATALAPPHGQSAVSSSWFVAAYLGLIGPVVGAGRLVDVWGGRTAAASFGFAITVLAIMAALLARQSRPLPG